MTYPYDDSIETYEVNAPEQADIKSIPVVVQNFPVVEQGANQYVNCRTFNETGQVLEVLQMDPYRDRAVLVVSGVGTVVLCHSETNANGVLSEVVPESYGTVIVCPGATASFTIEYTSTAKIWAVLSGASPVLGVMSERRHA